MYAKYGKRILDVLLSLTTLILLSPVLILLTVVGAVMMRGNPFFTQLRPGREEKLFRLVKFRSMSEQRDAHGRLLPDEKRLTKYGKWLRATSLDELPELWNILKGDMSFVGPRPLLVNYLPLYNEAQRHRHDVRPGLTGLAQAQGRNLLSWEERFRLDVQYVHGITLLGDVKIILETVGTVFSGTGIHSATSVTMEEFTGSAE